MIRAITSCGSAMISAGVRPVTRVTASFTYSNDNETAIRIDVEGDLLSVRTWNRAAPERITALKAGIDRLMAAADPDRYYQEQMSVAAKRSVSRSCACCCRGPRAT